MVQVADIVGITDQQVERLHEVGIRTTAQLLEVGATSSGRMRLADEAQLDDKTIKALVHQADLLRLPDMNATRAAALCEAGVCTVPKLAYRSAEMLHEDLVQSGSAGKVPTVHELQEFIVAAKRLPKIVHH